MAHFPKPGDENRPTPTIEDYLAILYVMERDGEEVVAARLAESLEVAPPTVTVTTTDRGQGVSCGSYAVPKSYE